MPAAIAELIQTLIIGLTVLCGVNFVFWGGVGLLRLITEKLGGGKANATSRPIFQGMMIGFFWGAISTFAFWLLLELVGLFLIHQSVNVTSTQFLGGAGIFFFVMWIILGGWGAWMVGSRLANRPDVVSYAFAAQAFAHLSGGLIVVLPAALASGFTPDQINAGITILFVLAILCAFIGKRLRLGFSHPHSAEQPHDKTLPITAADVAVVIPAHNEEHVLPVCLKRLGQIMPMSNVYLGNDGSTDQTASIAEAAGCQIVQMRLNKGKAFTIQRVLDEQRICDRYSAVMILDADSEVDPHYLERALPLLNRPGTAAVAGHVLTKWRKHLLPRWPMFFIAYRMRLYLILQAVLRYGQTWRPTNVHYIIPGFASIYRTEALKQLDVAAEGLIIEDFNMTFELHRKRLGKIAYSPNVRCISQDPTSFKDYFRQLKRWNLGFWQTVRRNGIWPSMFWASLSVFVAELMIFSVFMLMLPFLLLYLSLNEITIAIDLSLTGGAPLTLNDIFVGIILFDYGLTIIAAIIERKPLLLFYGIGFVAIRFIDAFLLLYSLVLSFIVSSDGRWCSPART